MCVGPRPHKKVHPYWKKERILHFSKGFLNVFERFSQRLWQKYNARHGPCIWFEPRFFRKLFDFLGSMLKSIAFSKNNQFCLRKNWYSWLFHSMGGLFYGDGILRKLFKVSQHLKCSENKKLCFELHGFWMRHKKAWSPRIELRFCSLQAFDA